MFYCDNDRYILVDEEIVFSVGTDDLSSLSREWMECLQRYPIRLKCILFLNRIYVGNLSPFSTMRDVIDLFSSDGDIVGYKEFRPYTRQTGQYCIRNRKIIVGTAMELKRNISELNNEKNELPAINRSPFNGFGNDFMYSGYKMTDSQNQLGNSSVDDLSRQLMNLDINKIDDEVPSHNNEKKIIELSKSAKKDVDYKSDARPHKNPY
ncbi:hypothetical protein ACOME3_010219 [Neoechinorhynchus agilis]